MVFVQHELYLLSCVFEYCFECSEIDIASGVVFFGTLGRGIDAQMTEMSLQSYSDEELDTQSFPFLFGVPMIPMGVLFYVIFVLAIVSVL